jgi:hypothetical protein
MKKLYSYISILVLGLLLFPIAEKAAHDLEHFNEDHCEIKDTHYCKAEHNCSICDYTFSSSSILPKTQDQITVFSIMADDLASVIVSNQITSPKFRLSLRGPPIS